VQEQYKKYVGQRCYHKTLGAYGEVHKAIHIYGEDIIYVQWDNGSYWPYSVDQFEEFVEVRDERVETAS
jgi:hypothetical protein